MMNFLQIHIAVVIPAIIAVISGIALSADRYVARKRRRIADKYSHSTPIPATVPKRFAPRQGPSLNPMTGEDA